MTDYPHICKYCRYQQYKACWYNPPTAMFVDYHWTSAHPPVLDDDRCSKWELKSKLKNKENDYEV